MTGGKGFGLITAAVGRAANMAGGPATMGNATYGFSSGINGIWFSISNIFAMWISAPFASRIYKTMKKCEIYTIGSYLGHRFGKFAQIFGGLTNFLAYLGFVASNITATGVVLHIILGLNLTTCIIFSMIITTIYTALGGLKSVYWVNLFQIAVMITGFLFILLPFTVNSMNGGLSALNNLPETHRVLDWSKLGVIFGSIILPTAVTGFTTQAGYIAVYSSKTRQIGWKSTLLAGIIYALIVFPILIVGSFAFILYGGDEAQSILTTVILKLLPTGLVGLLTASIISATMSTAASCAINAMTCLKVDVIGPLKKESNNSLLDKIFESRNLIVIINLIALTFALILPSILKLLLIGYSLATGGLLIPVFATIFWKRATTLGVNASMLVGGLSFVIVKFTMPNIVPLYVSLPLSFIALIVGSYISPKQDNKILEDYFG